MTRISKSERLHMTTFSLIFTCISETDSKYTLSSFISLTILDRLKVYLKNTSTKLSSKLFSNYFS